MRINKFESRVCWLAEQGLALKSVFLVIIPLIIFLITKKVKNVLKKKEGKRMGNKINTIDVLNAIIKIVDNLCGNIAGGALLTNAL